MIAGASQLDLLWDGGEIVEPEGEVGATIDERFEAFHAANPRVYVALTRMARLAQRQGRKVGIKTIYEALRWQVAMATTGDSGFKLNNDFTALYAREIMDREADLEGFFDIRRRRALRPAA